MRFRITVLASAFVLAAAGVLPSLLSASSASSGSQQQAAEAPASARPGMTRPAVAGRQGLVTTGHPIASSAGLQMLLKGGNAFDAAAAVGAMAALGEPEMNGIGGNGFMTVFHKATGKVWSLSMAGAAPKGIVPAEMTAETLERRHEGRHRARQPRRLSLRARALRHDEHGRSVRAGDRIRRAGLSDRSRCWRSRSRAAATTSRSIRPPRRSSCPTASRSRPATCCKNPDYAATLRKLVEAENSRPRRRARSRCGGHPSGVRSLLQGRHRAGVRSLLQGERRRADGGGPRGLQAAMDRAAAHDLSRPRRLQQPGHFARRLRSAHGRQPDRSRWT